MPEYLATMLKSHAFLRRVLVRHGERMSATVREQATADLDRVFLDIVRYRSSDPRITLAQTGFLLTTLAQLTDPTIAAALHKICQRHLDQLQGALAPSPVARAIGAVDDNSRRYLDSLSDRVAVFDREYRYTFVNKANADFHGEQASDFVGRPSWLVTGERFFRGGNKPRFDACLAGQSVHCISTNPHRDQSRLFSVTFDPIRGADGGVTSVIAVSHELTGKPVPKEAITPLP